VKADIAHQPLLGGRKLEGLPKLEGLVTKHACDRQTDRQTDRRTDGRTELRLPRPR